MGDFILLVLQGPRLIDGHLAGLKLLTAQDVRVEISELTDEDLT
jgi:hypothetical protein